MGNAVLRIRTPCGERSRYTVQAGGGWGGNFRGLSPMRDRRRRVDDNSGRGATTNGVTARRGQTLDPPAPKCGLGMGKTIGRTFCGLQLVFGTAGECGGKSWSVRVSNSRPRRNRCPGEHSNRYEWFCPLNPVKVDSNKSQVRQSPGRTRELRKWAPTKSRSESTEPFPRPRRSRPTSVYVTTTGS